VEDGIVTLSGHVPSYAQKTLVERVVSRVKGVKGLAEEIEVRVPGFVGVSDDEIAKHAVDTMKWSTLVPDDRVQVKVQKGWITLTGTLDWQYQKAGAADVLKGIKGVTGISNRIELRPRVSSVDVKKRIEGALKRNAQLEAKGIIVNVAGNKVILEGNVKAWSERRMAERAAWATPGVTAVDDRLTVS
jgi:osmotically-inducible protein OsmY